MRWATTNQSGPVARCAGRPLTNEVPLPVTVEVGRVAGVVLQRQVDGRPVVRPRAELQVAALVVERKPADVDLAGAEEESRRHPEAVAVRGDDHVRVVRAVDILVGAANTPVQPRHHACYMGYARDQQTL